MAKTQRCTFVVVVAASVLSCSRPVEPAHEPAPVTHPAFELGFAERRALVERALSIQRGDSRRAVVQKMGEPTSDEILARKEDARVIGRSMRYDALRWEAGLVNEIRDEYVNVYLDHADYVQSVTIRVRLQP